MFDHPTYNRCIALGQYQNAANIRGCSVATVMNEQRAMQKTRQAVEEASAVIKVYPAKTTRRDQKPENIRTTQRDAWLTDAMQRLMRAGVLATDMSREMGLNKRAVSAKINGTYMPKKEWRDNFEAAFARILARKGLSAADYAATINPDAKPSVPSGFVVPSYVKDACEIAGIEPSALMDRGRHKELTHARQHVMWLLHQRGWSYTKIGQALGGMNHATIIHGVAAHQKRLAKDGGISQ